MLRQRLVQRGECHQRSLKEEQDKAHVLQGPAIIGPHEEEHAGDLLIEPSWLGSIEARNLSVVCLGTFEKRADPHHTLLAHKLMGTASVASRMLSEKGWDDVHLCCAIPSSIIYLTVSAKEKRGKRPLCIR